MGRVAAPPPPAHARALTNTYSTPMSAVPSHSGQDTQGLRVQGGPVPFVKTQEPFKKELGLLSSFWSHQSADGGLARRCERSLGVLPGPSI